VIFAEVPVNVNFAVEQEKAVLLMKLLITLQGNLTLFIMIAVVAMDQVNVEHVMGQGNDRMVTKNGIRGSSQVPDTQKWVIR
jgi:BarA-like signal transduction histidine kinase